MAVNLRVEIVKPQYAALVAAKNWAGLAAAINAANLDEDDDMLVTDRVVMAKLPLADSRSVLAKLKGLASTDVLIEHTYARLKGDGVNVAHPKTQNMIDFIATAGVPAEFRLTNAERDALKRLGVRSHVCTERAVVEAYNANLVGAP